LLVARKNLIVYQTKAGKEPFRDWITGFKDKVTRARIERRLEKVAEGHYGDYKGVGEGVYELRYFFGAGYRVYFAEDGDTLVLLLCGGDKSSQNRDITKAQAYWQDYQSSKPKAADDSTDEANMQKKRLEDE
jgi:putative addiction module killer protein